MTDHPPIPSSLWLKILAFLKDEATGSITLDVHRGRVVSVALNQKIREETPMPLPNTGEKLGWEKRGG